MQKPAIFSGNNKEQKKKAVNNQGTLFPVK
jgi:hypothetical protein